MYKEHPAFKKPNNPDTVIWRYLSFTKFVSLIVSKSLFFSTMSELKKLDPYEGTLPAGNQKLRLPSSDLVDESLRFMFEIYDEHAPQFLDMSVVNCWHINNSESYAMWKLYLPSGEGVVIRSTFERLSKCFIVNSTTPTKSDGTIVDVHIGEIEYVDHHQGSISEDNLLFRLLHKDISFAHERELRAVSLLFPETLSSPISTGVGFTVDLQMLVESIVLPPLCPSWVKTLAKSLLEQYGVSVPVKDSKLWAETT